MYLGFNVVDYWKSTLCGIRDCSNHDMHSETCSLSLACLVCISFILFSICCLLSSVCWWVFLFKTTSASLCLCNSASACLARASLSSFCLEKKNGKESWSQYNTLYNSCLHKHCQDIKPDKPLCIKMINKNIGDACNPKPEKIVYSTMRYKSDKVQRSGDFQSKQFDMMLYTYTP